MDLVSQIAGRAMIMVGLGPGMIGYLKLGSSTITGVGVCSRVS